MSAVTLSMNPAYFVVHRYYQRVSSFPPDQFVCSDSGSDYRKKVIGSIPLLLKETGENNGVFHFLDALPSICTKLAF